MTTTTSGRHHPRLAQPAPGQRLAGLAALVKAATYVIGFAAMAAYLGPRGFVDAAANPAESLSFLLQNQTMMYVWYLLLYIVGGFALIAVVAGLHERTSGSSPLQRCSSVVGFIWAGLLLASGLIALVGQSAVVALAADDVSLATSTWSAVSIVQDALGGGIEVVGAVWVLVVSMAGLGAGTIGRRLGVLGLLIGAAGMMTLVPALAEATTALFGLGFIVWFIGIGVVMLRPRR